METLKHLQMASEFLQDFIQEKKGSAATKTVTTPENSCRNTPFLTGTPPSQKINVKIQAKIGKLIIKTAGP